jgi:flagellar biosynthesis protein FlhF
MRIKKFTGPSLKEATEQMRKDLGPDAIILNTRKIPRGGGLGFLGRELFELTAAIDEVPQGQTTTYSRRQSGTPFDRYLNAAAPRPAENNAIDGLTRMAEQFEARTHQAERQSVPQQAMDVAGILDLRNEMQDMKGALQNIMEHLRYANMPEYPAHLQNAYATLIKNDVEEQLARELVQSVHASLTREQMNNKQATETCLLGAIARLVNAPPPPKAGRRKTTVVSLVGPTGVGKTTTIAKLAAIHKLVHRKSVALISTDTYRIGAIEQLRTFAAIADMPMEVVYRPGEIAAALRKFRDKDLIFIDTVGRSQRSKKELAGLAKFVSAASPDEVHLVLSASTGLKTALDTVNQFKAVKPNRLLFSKLDEAVTLGPLLSLVHKHSLPVGYVTVGQTVPDDIVVMDPAKFASMVYSGAAANA